MTRETWKPIPGYNGKYEVSDRAHVRSVSGTTRVLRRSCPYTRSWRGQLLVIAVNSNGYQQVSLGNGNSQAVHRLVARTFLGPCPRGQQVRHKDDNRLDSRLKNLEYGTPKQNVADAVRNGKRRPPRRQHANP